MTPRQEAPVEREWVTVIAGTLAYLTAAGATPATLKVRRRYLRFLAEFVDAPPWQASLDDLLRFVAQDEWAPETRKSARAAIRCLYRYGIHAGHITDDVSARLPPVKVPRALPRPAPLDVLATALARADNRAKLMLLFAAFAGLRRAEIAAVHTDDIIGDVLWVKGKGGVMRKVPLCPAIMGHLAFTPPGYVFPGKINGHLSPNRVGNILSGLLEGRWTGHTLRHQLAGRFHAANHDTLALQRLLGHARPETTAIYTDIPMDSLRSALFATVAPGLPA